MGQVAEEPAKKKTPWARLIIVVVAAIAISSAITIGTGYLSNPKVNTANKATFSQYGFSIQYPSGVQTQTKGLQSSQADSGSGQVSWTWNGGSTQLIVTWINASGYNYTAAFDGIASSLRSSYTNVQMTGSGSTTIQGTSWQYQTFSFNSNGQSGYVTYAIKYFQSEGRAYLLGFADSSPDTLSSLGSWAATFSG